MKRFELISFESADALARAAADAWLAEVEAAKIAGREHCVALSGGRIAEAFFARSAERAGALGLDLSHAHFFWADERCVPPEDAQSNFRLAFDLLLAPLRVPQHCVHRIRGELPPDEAAAEARREICRIAPLLESGQPSLDLVMLGMGEDGHVASLFPAEPDEIKSSRAVYRAVRNSPKPPPNRITLGYAAIVAARRVWVLVSGAGKEEALRQSLDLSGRTSLGRVLALRPHTKIFSDVVPGNFP
jgi:6-phosphogluconolactonase